MHITTEYRQGERLAAVFAAGERLRPRIRVVTFALSAAVAVIAGINAFYIVVTGGQLSLGAIAIGLERTSDAWHIASWDGPIPALIGTALPLAFLPACPRP